MLKLVLFPFRLIARLFGASKTGGERLARASGQAGRAGRTARRSVAAAAAAVEMDEGAFDENFTAPGGSVFFERMVRPRLSEKVAAELTLAEADQHVGNAVAFYRNKFDLLPKGDLFYEEIETEFVRGALGGNGKSVDAKFVSIIDTYRKITNGNARRLLLYITPTAFVAALAAAIAIVAGLPIDGVNPELFAPGAFAVVLAVAAVGVFAIYNISYFNQQQRNTLGLDNYVANKFNRINNNLQVARQRAMNVERDFDLKTREDLMRTAFTWTLCYHWMGLRLFLAELAIRNMAFQIRRNITLYHVFGQVICAAIALGAAGLLGLIAPLTTTQVTASGGMAAAFIAVCYWFVLRNPFAVVGAILRDNEWSRFHTVDLPATVRDHVGQDKEQIVRFRDQRKASD